MGRLAKQRQHVSVKPPVSAISMTQIYSVLSRAKFIVTYLGRYAPHSSHPLCQSVVSNPRGRQSGVTPRQALQPRGELGELKLSPHVAPGPLMGPSTGAVGVAQGTFAARSRHP